MIAVIKDNKDEERSHPEMREKRKNQMPLLIPAIEHPRAEELLRIGRILDENPIISEMVWQDLTSHVHDQDGGAHGMSAEQVLRAAIIKQMEGFSYEELAFHLLDSSCYRNFCRFGFTHEGFGKSALCATIKAISTQTWEAINRILVTYAEDAEIEKGREVRMDSTVVSANIHEPSDSTLLWDGVRVITRILTQLKEGVPIVFSDHTKVAKRRMLAIQHAKNDQARRKIYRDLLKVSEKVRTYAKNAVRMVETSACLHLIPIVTDLKQVLALTQRVIDQTTRRVIQGESVPADEKVVSLFESHTDIIKKDRRDTLYGHKICLGVGHSNLVTDCLIVKGNPADSTLMDTMLERHNQIYGRYPLKVALDGGFASKSNLDFAKSKEIKDVCFAKKRGLSIRQMCRSEYVYKRLRRFRAGVESAISWLKRCFGLDRCTWKSLSSFYSYVWASIVSANLLTLARNKI
jgi:transposase, IS5 family